MDNDYIKESMSMWGHADFEEFEIKICDGWNLILSEEAIFPLSPGHVYGRLSKELSGLELRKDKNFLSAKPLYVLQGNPHPKLLDLWSVAKQYILSRDDCVGYVPKKLCSCSCEDACSCLHDFYSFESARDDFPDYDEEPRRNDVRVSTKDLWVILPDDKKVTVSDCIFLGTRLCREDDLYLKTVSSECLYSVHKSLDDTMIGYLFTVKIMSPDLTQFHSDEGYYHVGVTVPTEGIDFIALLGAQNKLNCYELDDKSNTKLKGCVNVDDLFSFDQEAEKYFKLPPPRYRTLKRSGRSMATWVGPGHYVIVGCQTRERMGWSNGPDVVHGLPCDLKGEDNQGNKYMFPKRGFELKKVKSNEKNTIHLPRGGYAEFWDGNVVIEKNDGGTFRMYTNLFSIEYGLQQHGDMSEYDRDSQKTLKKLELAIKEAHDDYMKSSNSDVPSQTNLA